MLLFMIFHNCVSWGGNTQLYFGLDTFWIHLWTWYIVSLWFSTIYTLFVVYDFHIAQQYIFWYFSLAVSILSYLSAAVSCIIYYIVLNIEHRLFTKFEYLAPQTPQYLQIKIGNIWIAGYFTRCTLYKIAHRKAYIAGNLKCTCI